MALNIKNFFSPQDKPSANSQTELHLKKVLKRRSTSFVFDLIVIMIFNKICMISYTLFLEKYFVTVPKPVQKYLLTRLNKLEIITFAIIFTGYFTFCNYMMDGQTVGKVIFHLKIKNYNNSHLTLKEALLRSVGYFVCYFTGSFLFLFPWFNKERKGIPDWISNTYVDLFEEIRGKNNKSSLNKYVDQSLTLKEENILEFTTFPGQNQSTEITPEEQISKLEDKKIA